MAAQAIPLAIVYEDDALLVLDKPAGLVVHPGSGNRDGTLQNALLHHAPALATLPRAGIVHRLDKDTSGLMVVAKTETAQVDLVRQLAARSVKREYVAVVFGDLARATTIDAPIGRHPTQRTEMAVVTAGKPARTHVDVIERFGAATLVQCRLETGRTHQIRVHLTALGHPLLGDPTYRGRRKPGPPLPAAAFSFPRQALHARRLGLVHPVTRAPMQWESPRAGRPRGADRGAARRRNRTCAAMSDALADRLKARGLDWIVPAWQGPARVRAFFTTRNGGTSTRCRRRRSISGRPLHPPPTWPARSARTGGASARCFPPLPCGWRRCTAATSSWSTPTAVAALRAAPPQADAAVTRAPGIVLAVRTADCLPVLLAARDGSVLAVAHAGWRGLAAGVLEAAVTAMDVPARDVAAWIGPAIGPSAFEVGADVLPRIAHPMRARPRTSCRCAQGKWLADLPALAHRRLAAIGVTDVAVDGALHALRCAALPLLAARPVERAHGAAGVARAGMTPRQ